MLTPQIFLHADPLKRLLPGSRDIPLTPAVFYRSFGLSIQRSALLLGLLSQRVADWSRIDSALINPELISTGLSALTFTVPGWVVKMEKVSKKARLWAQSPTSLSTLGPY